MFQIYIYIRLLLKVLEWNVTMNTSGFKNFLGLILIWKSQNRLQLASVTFTLAENLPNIQYFEHKIIFFRLIKNWNGNKNKDGGLMTVTKFFITGRK